jgi:hypothetical protein
MWPWPVWYRWRIDGLGSNEDFTQGVRTKKGQSERAVGQSLIS